MTTSELVNLIVKKFGGNRVEFLNIEHERVEFVLGGNIYDCLAFEDNTVNAYHIQRDQGPLTITQYSTWVEGVLNGGTRNDAGVVS